MRRSVNWLSNIFAQGSQATLRFESTWLMDLGALACQTVLLVP